MDLAHQLDRNLQLLGCLKELVVAQGNNVADLLWILRIWRTA